MLLGNPVINQYFWNILMILVTFTKRTIIIKQMRQKIHIPYSSTNMIWRYYLKLYIDASNATHRDSRPNLLVCFCSAYLVLKGNLTSIHETHLHYRIPFLLFASKRVKIDILLVLVYLFSQAPFLPHVFVPFALLLPKAFEIEPAVD